MPPITVGLFGFGRTGRLVANKFLRDSRFAVRWVVRRSHDAHHKHASALLGLDAPTDKIFSVDDLRPDFCRTHRVDVIVDFAGSAAGRRYAVAASEGTRIISAVSRYRPSDYAPLQSLSAQTAVLFPPTSPWASISCSSPRRCCRRSPHTPTS